MRALGVICARAGSKRVPEKVLQLVDGVPLKDHALQAALESRLLTWLIMAADADYFSDPYHAVPVLLPKNIADSSIIETLNYALDHYPYAQIHPEIVVTLQACIAFHTGVHIDRTITMLERCNLDSAQTVVNVGWDHAPIWKPNGAVYATRVEWIRQGKIIGPRHGCVVMQPEESVNIDTEYDLRLARALCASSS